MSPETSRRRFLRQGAVGMGVLALAGCRTAAPAIATGQRKASPNARLQLAVIGVGGQGRKDLETLVQDHDVVALCDVDSRALTQAKALCPEARHHRDWRELLGQPGLDGVSLATPDHMHAPIAMSAMQQGLHVFVQTPMAHTIYEARMMAQASITHGVVTQTGNGQHCSSGFRTLMQVVRQMRIGLVLEAHAWTDRPVWPQGMIVPRRQMPVPEHLDWDLWLGVAAERPYAGGEVGDAGSGALYPPFNWRGWVDFGGGALGDMGGQLLDPLLWSLGLGAPLSVTSFGPGSNGASFPEWQVIQWGFRPSAYTVTGLFRVNWYDGNRWPERSRLPIPQGQPLPPNGCLLVGTEGAMIWEPGELPLLLPEEKFGRAQLKPLPGEDPITQWLSACKGEGGTDSNLAQAGPLTEAALLGTVAVHYPETPMNWDSEGLRFPNHPDADLRVHRPYRKGWHVRLLG